MKKLSLNISLLPSNAWSRALRFPPQRYWDKLLLVFGVLALLVLVFDIWIFWATSRTEPLAGEEVRLSASRQSSLEKVYAEAERRSNNFEKYRRGISIPDPAQ